MEKCQIRIITEAKTLQNLRSSVRGRGEKDKKKSDGLYSLLHVTNKDLS